MGFGLYGDKYTINHVSQEGDSMEIVISEFNYAAGVTEIKATGDPINIIYGGKGGQGVEGKFAGCWKSRADIALIEDTILGLQEFAFFEVGKYLVEFNYEGSREWFGYLAPSVYSSRYVRGVRTVIIRAYDLIGLADRKPFNRSVIARDNILRFLRRTLLHADGFASIQMREAIQYYGETMNQGAGDSPLDQANLDTDLFMNDGKETLGSALDEVARAFGARIFHAANSFYILNIDNLKEVNNGGYVIRSYDDAGVFISSGLQTQKTVISDTNFFYDQTASIRLLNGLARVLITAVDIQAKAINVNPYFESIGAAFTPNNWTLNGTLVLANGSGEGYTGGVSLKIPTPQEFNVNNYLVSDSFPNESVSAGTSGEHVFSAWVRISPLDDENNFQPDGNFRVTIMVNGQSVDNAGNWVAGNVNILNFDLPFNFPEWQKVEFTFNMPPGAILGDNITIRIGAPGPGGIGIRYGNLWVDNAKVVFPRATFTGVPLRFYKDSGQEFSVDTLDLETRLVNRSDNVNTIKNDASGLIEDWKKVGVAEQRSLGNLVAEGIINQAGATQMRIYGNMKVGGKFHVERPLEDLELGKIFLPTFVKWSPGKHIVEGEWLEIIE